MHNLQNKVVVITGAASGIGRALADVAAQYKMRLVLADVDLAGLDKVSHDLTQQGVQVLTLPCDVSQAAQVQNLADQAIATFGVVDIVFNNAGVAVGGLTWENSLADWQWVLGVNVWGVIHGMHSFVPKMLAYAKEHSGYRGHIVNTASMAGLINPPVMGVYNVSKHAVVALSESLFTDLQLINAPIGVSVLCPYFVPTGIADSDRNRPKHLENIESATASQIAAQVLSEKAIASGKLSALDIAYMAFNAVVQNKFYIISHPGALGAVHLRMEDVLTQGNPRDPFITAPHIGQMLRDNLQKAEQDLLSAQHVSAS